MVVYLHSNIHKSHENKNKYTIKYKYIKNIQQYICYNK